MWLAGHVGETATPLLAGDVDALAATLVAREFDAGELVFEVGEEPTSVWILRDGAIELSVSRGRRAVIDVLRPGAVEGDIALLRRMPMAYTARALERSTCLGLEGEAFEALLATHPNIARRWLSSLAERLLAARERLIAMLGRSLPARVARLLLDESVDGSVQLTQRTIAAMLGVQRPSVNKVLKDFERDRLITIHYAGVDILDVDGLLASGL